MKILSIFVAFLENMNFKLVFICAKNSMHLNQIFDDLESKKAQ